MSVKESVCVCERECVCLCGHYLIKARICICIMYVRATCREGEHLWYAAIPLSNFLFLLNQSQFRDS